MGIQVQADVSQPTTIFWAFTGRWTITDLERALDVSDRLLNCATEPLDFVIDISHGGLIPLQFVGFLRRHKSRPHTLSGAKIVIGADRYLRIFWTGLADWLPRYCQLVFADSMDDARTLLVDRGQPVLS